MKKINYKSKTRTIYIQNVVIHNKTNYRNEAFSTDDSIICYAPMFIDILNYYTLTICYYLFIALVQRCLGSSVISFMTIAFQNEIY